MSSGSSGHPRFLPSLCFCKPRVLHGGQFSVLIKSFFWHVFLEASWIHKHWHLLGTEHLCFLQRLRVRPRCAQGLPSPVCGQRVWGGAPSVRSAGASSCIPDSRARVVGVHRPLPTPAGPSAIFIIVRPWCSSRCRTQEALAGSSSACFVLQRDVKGLSSDKRRIRLSVVLRGGVTLTQIYRIGL